MTIRSGVAAPRVHRALTAWVAVAASGCDLVRDPTAFDVDDGPIAVHAMLVAGERRIAVLVTRYESGDEPDRTLRLMPVPGADVRVTGAGQTVDLDVDGTAAACVNAGYAVTEVPASLAPGCYSGRAEDAVVAGGQYTLHITLSDGTIVTGEAEVPMPVTVRTPEAGAQVEVWAWYPADDPALLHTLAWSDASADRAVRLWLEVDLENCQGPWTTQEPDSSALRDPAFGLPRAIDLTGRDSADVGGWYLACDGPPPDEADGALQLAVFDLAYTQYLDTLARSQSIALEHASIGVSGAVGVFTAAAVTRVPVRVIIRCPADRCPWPD